MNRLGFDEKALFNSVKNWKTNRNILIDNKYILNSNLEKNKRKQFSR